MWGSVGVGVNPESQCVLASEGFGGGHEAWAFTVLSIRIMVCKANSFQIGLSINKEETRGASGRDSVIGQP